MPANSLTLFSGRVTLELIANRVSLILYCPTDDEAKLTFAELERSWQETGQLRLLKKENVDAR